MNDSSPKCAACDVQVAHGVTIDAETTRDMDDAIWVSERPAGLGWIVTVSIAHVSGEVPIGSPADEAARKAVVTRYFASGNSPMLSRTLEQDLSLWPDRPKKTITVEVALDAAFKFERAEVFFSRLRSQAKLTYTEIPSILSAKHHALHMLLKSAVRVAMGLLDRRRAAGAMVLYDLNNGWTVTEEGLLKQLDKKEATIGYIVVQELMILANTAVARWAIDRDLPVLFRNHRARAASPDRADLMRQISEAVVTPLANLDALRERTHLLLARAEYGAQVDGHFGLNLPCYLHFTSPIRRYADLVTHRQVRAALLGDVPPYTREDIDTIALHINDTLTELRDATSDGLTVIAFSSGVNTHDGVKPDDVARVFTENTPRGGTNLTAALEAAVSKKRESKKNAVIMVYTDGVPDDETTAMAVIDKAGKEFGRPGIGFCFVQVGTDSGATKFLDKLDNDLSTDVTAAIKAEDAEGLSAAQLVYLAQNA